MVGIIKSVVSNIKSSQDMATEKLFLSAFLKSTKFPIKSSEE